MENDGERRLLNDGSRIGYEIRTIHNLIGTRADKYMKSRYQDLTHIQAWVIGFLYDRQEQDTYQRDIEETFDISRATATKLLQLMEKKGLIIRHAVPHDGRLKKILLLEKAVAIHKAVMNDIMRIDAQLVEGMSREEIETLKRLLARVRENIRKEIEDCE